MPLPATTPGAAPPPPAEPPRGDELSGRVVVLIGGAGGIGLRVAHRAVAAGARVVLGGRTPDKLAAAAAALGDAADWHPVEVTDPGSVAAFFGPLDRVDHVFTTAADYRVGPMRELSDEDAASPFTSKFWGQYHVAKHAAPLLSQDGSVVLMSGAAGARPPAPAPAYAACNAAIEGLARGLAVELAPVRVNVVSPGTVDGNLWAGRPAQDREAAFAQYTRDTLLPPARHRGRDRARGAVPLHQPLPDRLDALPGRGLHPAVRPGGRAESGVNTADRPRARSARRPARRGSGVLVRGPGRRHRPPGRQHVGRTVRPQRGERGLGLLHQGPVGDQPLPLRIGDSGYGGRALRPQAHQRCVDGGLPDDLRGDPAWRGRGTGEERVTVTCDGAGGGCAHGRRNDSSGLGSLRIFAAARTGVPQAWG
ncbi:SDR family NAD(P)-dependent oxidoreductase [Streptomyces sp. NPDC001657]|uniref:SDR family NAD(P)-dependent oxidoreductase n=1 Tax=Streptomyces sp. NPDC001657 TaxID=3154522 RepID=UPI003328860D